MTENSKKANSDTQTHTQTYMVSSRDAIASKNSSTDTFIEYYSVTQLNCQYLMV